MSTTATTEAPGGDPQQELKRLFGLIQTRQRGAALEGIRSLVARAGDQPMILAHACSLALRLEALAEAREWALRLDGQQLPDWQSAQQVADLLRGAGLHQAAAASLQRACARFPEQPTLLAKAAELAAGRGDMDAARRSYRAALQLQPGLSAPYLFLARDEASDPEVLLAQLEDLSEQGLSAVQRANLQIARGCCLDRCQRWQAAFEAFAAAREMTRDASQRAALERQIGNAPALLNDFSAQRMRDQRHQGHGSARPVFVVGLPRSGSTLVAQLLAAHRDIDSLGERRILGNVVHRQFSASSGQSSLLDALSSPPGQLERLGADYLQQAAELAAPDAARWVDKLPFNFSLLGPAHLIFPAARSVYTRRDPLDTCWSMFTAAFQLNFLQLGLAEIGQLSALAEFLTKQWQERVPGALLVVDYEKLVGAFEHGARRIVSHLELDWDADCVAFHRQDNDVMTASTVQVRQPVYSASVGRSSPYREWLQPFVQARATTLMRLEQMMDDTGRPIQP